MCGWKNGWRPERRSGWQVFENADGGRGFSGCQAGVLPEPGWGEACPFPKGLNEIALVLKAAFRADIQKGQIGFQKELPGLLDTKRNGILHGRGPNGTLKTPQAFPAA